MKPSIPAILASERLPLVKIYFSKLFQYTYLLSLDSLIITGNNLSLKFNGICLAKVDFVHALTDQ